jgi:hypothetical protein
MKQAASKDLLLLAPHWFPENLVFNPEDGGDRFLRNVG